MRIPRRTKESVQPHVGVFEVVLQQKTDLLLALVVRCQPLLSPPAPLSVLREEYERGSAIFVKKIDTLARDGWKTVWRAKGDGDCFVSREETA